MRKDAGFAVMDHIRVTYHGNDKLDAVIMANKEAIAKVVLAESVSCQEPVGFVKEWNINGETLHMGVERCAK